MELRENRKEESIKKGRDSRKDGVGSLYPYSNEVGPRIYFRRYSSLCVWSQTALRHFSRERLDIELCTLRVV